MIRREMLTDTGSVVLIVEEATVTVQIVGEPVLSMAQVEELSAWLAESTPKGN